MGCDLFTYYLCHIKVRVVYLRLSHAMINVTYLHAIYVTLWSVWFVYLISVWCHGLLSHVIVICLYNIYPMLWSVWFVRNNIHMWCYGQCDLFTVIFICGIMVCLICLHNIYIMLWAVSFITQCLSHAKWFVYIMFM